MTIPVVQGVAVQDAQQQQSQTPYYGSHAPAQAVPVYEDGGSGWMGNDNNNNNNASGGAKDDGYIYTEQEKQQLRENPPIHKFQDVGWAVAFWIHLVVIVGLCIASLSSGNGVEVDNDNGGSVEVMDILFVTGVCGLLAVGLCTVALKFMMDNAKTLVEAALVFSVLTSLAMALLGLMTGQLLLAIVGFISFAVGCCYAYFVWNRIPFAAVNLKVACQGVKSNLGLTFVAYIMIAIAFGWSCLWFLGLGNAFAGASLAIVFVLFLSYYWTHQVLQNTMHVTTCGVIGTWWFVPSEANQWWAPALSDSLMRATTYSFGSVCFGSFLVAFVRALRALEHYTRENRDMQIVSCIIQCILSCIEAIIEYLNKWAYVYVGLYGFSYVEAGRNVMTLFQQKGWTVIISDDLASNVLFMISAGIGLATGLVGMLMGWSDPNLFIGMGFENGAGPGFLVGFLIGFLFSSIFLGVVDSAISTVIVCYAEAPAEFQMNHPELATEMRSAWVQAWPGIVQ